MMRDWLERWLASRVEGEPIVVSDAQVLLSLIGVSLVLFTIADTIA
ncbi:hypothetical protein [Methylobacterium soli]|nr:hypothetical protein [Methylobacterium soli]GJE46668.1 hypothetical protein AEGHOMDF_5875 [Methylobacterium soli]